MKAKHPQLNTVSEKYGDFTVTKAIEIPELQCFLTELIHIPTGANIMHIGNEDPENLFCLSFQTLPYSSNGVAHILEHTVLCGSEKFPVKDPFFAMTRRSLNTYMNALTGQDFTCYPAASQIPADFYNLLDVYLDAVFKPNLKHLSFLQEGHRLEFTDPADPSSLLEYKGIVFNEMKGAMNSPMSMLGEALNQALFPDITYGTNSGGDPFVIPSLTYEELVEFHRQYYHPSRCLFFFYGNIPLVRHLDFIEEHTLKQAQKTSALPPVPLQRRHVEPTTVKHHYPIAAHETTEDKTMIAFGWLTCHILEQHELLGLSILEIILMDTDASPLKMALLKSGLCKSASAYIDVDINEAPTAIILKGCNPENADQLQSLIRRTLQKIVNEGISLDLIENAMHQLEFFRSEITGDHAPFGLSLFMRSALLKQHGAKPEEGLMIHSLFERFRQHLLKDPKYLTSLIQKHFLDNTHFAVVILEPSKEIEAQTIAQERAALDKIRESLSEKDVQDLVKQAKELAIFQKSQEEVDLDILPKISVEDIPAYTKDYELTKEKAQNFTVYHHNCFTNEIVYADLAFPLPELKFEELHYVRLFTVLLSQIGCGERNYAENLEFMQANTGGLSAFLSLNLQAEDHQLIKPTLLIKVKALHRKMPKLFELLKDVITNPHFSDVERLREVIHKHFTSLESSLNQNALRYAINLSSSGLTIPSLIANEWYGLDYFWKIKELAQNFDKQKESLVKNLTSIKNKILGVENPDLILSCDAKTYDEMKGNKFYGLTEVEISPAKPWKNNFTLKPVESQGRVITSSVAFIGKVFSTISYVDENSPALSLAAFLFDNLTLHSIIREQGGAYGGGAVNNSMSGNFYFYSYRDPNIFTSISAFEKAILTVLNGDFEEEDLEEAKFEMIQALDAPVSPGSRAEVAYSWLKEGKTKAIRQEFRNKLLSLTKQQIIDAVKKEILPKWESGATVVFAGQELLEKENQIIAAVKKEPLKIERI
jgi:hypothetical protein